MIATGEPSIEHLKEIVLDSKRDMPLHAQLRKALERLISDYFEDQSRFYSESQLIGNLGISQGTVRRALADLAASGKLEKRQARCTIVRKHSTTAALRNLAVFLPDFTSPNVARLLGHFNEECLDRGIRMQPIYTHRGERLLKAYSNLDFAPNEGGVVLLENSPRATIELASALGDKGYDCVIVGTVIKNSAHKFVGGSNKSMIEIGLRHLVDLGHRDIALLVSEPEEKESVQERIETFQSLTASYGKDLHPRVILAGAQLWDDPYEAAQKAMEEKLDPSTMPTAIFAVSDVGALGAIKWLQRRGFRVPDDVSVMGIGGIDAGAMVHPALTTLVGPFQDITSGVFRLLTGDDSVRRLLFESKLLVRESTAEPAV